MRPTLTPLDRLILHKLIEDGPLALPLPTTNSKTKSCMAFGTTYTGGGVHSVGSPTATTTSHHALFVTHLPGEGR